LSIEEIVQGCIDNDRNSQKKLFERYASDMLVVCMRYARHHLEAEDMLQEGLLNVYRNIKQYNRKGSFDGWVKRIVINSCLKEIRRFSFKYEEIGIEPGIEVKTDPKIYEQLTEKDIFRFIRSLPKGYRMVFNLYAIEGYSHKEIAELLQIEEGTSRSQLLKARKFLQNIIGKALGTLI